MAEAPANEFVQEALVERHRHTPYRDNEQTGRTQPVEQQNNDN